MPRTCKVVDCNAQFHCGPKNRKYCDFHKRFITRIKDGVFTHPRRKPRNEHEKENYTAYIKHYGLQG